MQYNFTFDLTKYDREHINANLKLIENTLGWAEWLKEYRDEWQLLLTDFYENYDFNKMFNDQRYYRLANTYHYFKNDFDNFCESFNKLGVIIEKFLSKEIAFAKVEIMVEAMKDSETSIFYGSLQNFENLFDNYKAELLKID